MAERRSIAADYIIKEICKEQRMTEVQLLVHLALGAAPKMLSEPGQQRVMWKSHMAHMNGVYDVEIGKE